MELKICEDNKKARTQPYFDSECQVKQWEIFVAAPGETL